MTYQETVEYLYNKLPAFQKSGNSALKNGLQNIRLLCEHLGHPENKFNTIHVAGTNGKGSSSHMMASVFQEAGYKTGLYTSPHLKDFRERFRINGTEVPEEFVVNFIAEHQALIERIKPSFFEVTVALAFLYFAEEKVDIAIIEVGLGGRLDSTNIITPVISLITNIGLDHTEILGDTLEAIAKEKAGIIKPGVPVVISEYQPETAPVFNRIAQENNSLILYAEDHFEISKTKHQDGLTNYIVKDKSDTLQWIQKLDLNGNYQQYNLAGVLTVFQLIRKKGKFNINHDHQRIGLANTISNTNLKGRWQKIGESPIIICDTGHNSEAIEYLIKRFEEYNESEIHIVLGFSKDKNWNQIMCKLPKKAHYYFAEFDSPRSANPQELLKCANINSIMDAKAFGNVNQALDYAKKRAQTNDFIFVGGSTYLVAELNDL